MRNTLPIDQKELLSENDLDALGYGSRTSRYRQEKADPEKYPRPVMIRGRRLFVASEVRAYYLGLRNQETQRDA